MADAASSQNGSALPAGTALREMPPEEREAFRQQLDALGISSTSKHHPVPQSGSGLTGAEAGSPHARAGTTLALEIDVHVDGMREPGKGPTISMDQIVRDIKTSIVKHLRMFQTEETPMRLLNITLRALWLPGDVPELNEEAEEVQIGRRKYSAVRLEVCAAAPQQMVSTDTYSSQFAILLSSEHCHPPGSYARSRLARRQPASSHTAAVGTDCAPCSPSGCCAHDR